MRVYLDWNSTSPMLPRIQSELAECWAQFGNPSSAHMEGRHARVAIETARSMLASHLHALPDHIWFASSGSEINTQFIYSLVMKQYYSGLPQHLVISTIEHPCIMNAADWAEQMGVTVSRCPVDNRGLIQMDVLATLIRPESLVSIMMVNNEVGVLQPVEAISNLVRSEGGLFHSDVIQAVGKIPIDFNLFDMATLSPHKCGGPKGIAIGLCRTSEAIVPLIQGGGQEHGWRSGTESMPLIVAGAQAIEHALQSPIDTQLQPLKTRLETVLHQVGGHLIAPHSISSTVAAYFEGRQAASVVRRLDISGISISAGSACSTGSIEPSHVGDAMGLPLAVQQGLFRMSMGWGSQMRDIEFVEECLKQWLT